MCNTRSGLTASAGAGIGGIGGGLDPTWWQPGLAWAGLTPTARTADILPPDTPLPPHLARAVTATRLFASPGKDTPFFSSGVGFPIGSAAATTPAGGYITTPVKSALEVQRRVSSRVSASGKPPAATPLAANLVVPGPGPAVAPVVVSASTAAVFPSRMVNAAVLDQWATHAIHVQYFVMRVERGGTAPLVDRDVAHEQLNDDLYQVRFAWPVHVLG